MESFKDRTRKGTFYFSHSGAILKFLAFLRLFEDPEPLLSNNYEKMRDQREWRTSKIGPFAGNIFFVLANGNPGDEFGGELSCDSVDEQRILMFVNEVETPIPGCGDSKGVCTLADLLAMHGAGRWGQGEGGVSCNFEEICRNEEGVEVGGEVADDKY